MVRLCPTNHRCPYESLLLSAHRKAGAGGAQKARAFAWWTEHGRVRTAPFVAKIRGAARQNPLDRLYAVLWGCAERQTDQCSRAHIARAISELSFESPTETRGIRKAEGLGYCRDRLGRPRIAQDGARFEQPLELNVTATPPVSSNNRCRLERDIPTSRQRLLGLKVGVCRCRRTACRTRSLRSRSTCPVATAIRSVDGATAAAIIAPTAFVSRGSRPRSRPAGHVPEPTYSRRADVREAYPAPNRTQHRAQAQYPKKRRLA